MIHGAIDGYSRLITFLRCSTNNKAETVAELFNNAAERYGTPSRVRTDKGGENTLVWEKMVHIRGENRGSYLASSSVHNQRIERLWRDVWNYVCNEFYYTFQAMIDQGILSMDNDVHKFILHYVFVPRINLVIESFVQGWNRHPLRTERNWSPERIWANGMVDQRNHNISHVNELVNGRGNINNEDLEWFGMDWFAPSPQDDGLTTVNLDDVVCPLDLDQLARLQNVDPLTHSTTYGIDVFITAMHVLL